MVAIYALSDEDLLAACIVRRGGASGPGGQHANKNATGVTLTHQSTGVVSQHHVHRDGRRNLQEALQRLRLRLALEIRGQAESHWLDDFRNGAGRLKVSAHNPRFHLVIACCFDTLAETEYDVRSAAETLACSVSQLVKCCAVDKEVWTYLMQQLTAHGRSTLRHP